MPVIYRFQGYRFFFYSNEGDPLESPHIHVRASGKEAKFWLVPEVLLARNDGFDARTIRILLELSKTKQQQFVEAWNDYFA